jgi:5-formyltetrahydrofolate cyclo-ligase
MDKKTARGQQIGRLKSYPADQRAAETAIIIQRLTELPEWQAAKSIATTISGPFEFNTNGVIEAAEATGKTVYLPKVMPKRQMAFMPNPGDSELIRSKFGLLEPAYDAATMNNAPDLVVVPGLAYALDTHKRLGFGGGYYDRFLAQYSGTTVALALPIQLTPSAFWPEDAFDIPLQHILTSN